MRRSNDSYSTLYVRPRGRGGYVAAGTDLKPTVIEHTASVVSPYRQAHGAQHGAQHGAKAHSLWSRHTARRMVPSMAPKPIVSRMHFGCAA